MDDILQIQLHSSGDMILTNRSHVVEISMPEARAKEPIPNIDGNNGSRTPLYGPQTPMYKSKYPHLCLYVYLLLTSEIVYEIVYEGS